MREERCHLEGKGRGEQSLWKCVRMCVCVCVCVCVCASVQVQM